jgi:hypothetical protein
MLQLPISQLSNSSRTTHSKPIRQRLRHRVQLLVAALQLLEGHLTFDATLFVCCDSRCPQGPPLPQQGSGDDPALKGLLKRPTEESKPPESDGIIYQSTTAR